MNAGEFANLQCIVPTGDLPLNIRWSYPGEEMGGSSGVLAKKVADRVSMLMISVITARHAGEYVCTAENAAGTASHSTTLTVNGSGLSSSVFLERYIIHFLVFTFSLFFFFVSLSRSLALSFRSFFLHNPGKEHRSEVPLCVSWPLISSGIENSPHDRNPLFFDQKRSLSRDLEHATSTDVYIPRYHCDSNRRDPPGSRVHSMRWDSILIARRLQLARSFCRSRSMPRWPTRETPCPYLARSWKATCRWTYRGRSTACRSTRRKTLVSPWRESANTWAPLASTASLQDTPESTPVPHRISPVPSVDRQH